MFILYRKNPFNFSFLRHFGEIWSELGKQKFCQIFSRWSTSCPFSAVNNLRLVYFIFRLKDLPEYSNRGNISSKFKNCNDTVPYLEIFWEYYFQLRTIFSYKHVWMTWLGFFFHGKYNCYVLINWRVYLKIEILNFEPSFKLWWCCGQSRFIWIQIPVTTEGFV